MNQKKTGVILLTGLSGSGKTTISQALHSTLQKQGHSCIYLDGDVLRNIVNVSGFDEQSRKTYNLSIGKLAALLEAQEHLVILALIAPYADTRLEMKNFCKNFLEVYISTPLEVCITRDPKGLYQKATQGEISNFTGISAPYEAPQHPALVLNTAALSIEACVTNILALL